MTDTPTLPAMVDAHGELVRLITAEDLLHVAGLGTSLHDAGLPDLGTFVDNATHLTAIAREASAIVGREVVRRLDRRGRWTIREGGFSFNAPSPTAGTTKYDTDKLLQALRDLVTLDVIDQEAADAALEPQHGTTPVTAGDLELIEAALKAGPGASETYLAGAMRVEQLRARIPATTYKQKPAGIAALRKLGADVDEAIATALEPVDPPERKPTIKREPAALRPREA